MKKKLLSLAMALTITLTGTMGVADVAKAANTKDETYSFYNMNSSITTRWRDKNNSSRVYVYPQSGPNLYYTVQCSHSTTPSIVRVCSSRVLIPQGVKASIINSINLNKENQARLKLERSATGAVTTTGVWSPDSTRDYTVYN